ncbi:hypothetical protein AAFF_G00282950 [Aldrovandia affinis]|uniref:Uncharacterized protein n=1 Tax=Aldrovandia affinis TaxID=143900 RepID=A0AAD7TAA6_9TELE|nr:hypothetical protein AAFF_G00282950 [Aldrovandia affinis]
MQYFAVNYRSQSSSRPGSLCVERPGNEGGGRICVYFRISYMWQILITPVVTAQEPMRGFMTEDRRAVPQDSFPLALLIVEEKPRHASAQQPLGAPRLPGRNETVARVSSVLTAKSM